MGVVLEYLMMTLLFVTSTFLILLVLVQRGRGGGLAGAFGGAGGQSAFGTKAGDVFTRITIVVAAIWIVLCAASVKLLGSSDDVVNAGAAPTTTSPVGAQGKATKPGESKSGDSKSGDSKTGESKSGDAAKSESKESGAQSAKTEKSPAPSNETVEAAPAASDKKAVSETPVTSQPPGSLTPNGSVAPQTPLPGDEK